MKKSRWLTLVACSLAAVIAVLATCTPSNAAAPPPWPPHPLPFPKPHPLPFPKPHPLPFPKPHPLPFPKPHPLPFPMPYRPVFRPIVVMPAPSYPVVSESPVTAYTPAPINPAPAIVLVAVLNPEDTGATLTFTIAGKRYELSPGMRQDFQVLGTRTIEFDRGESFGTATYRLSEGLYTFKATDEGWDLERLPYQPPPDSQ